MPAMRTVLDHAHNASDHKRCAMKGFHHPRGSQAAFLTGLAHLYNLIPSQRRVLNAGQWGGQWQAVTSRQRTGCSTCKSSLPEAISIHLHLPTTKSGGMWRRQALPDDTWTHLTVRDGEKGPVEIELVRRRVQTRIERKRTGPPEWLVITRRRLPDERPLEPRASRAATDQDDRYRYHYYLSPTCVSEVELEEPSLSELARVIKAGACIEIYQSCNLHKTLF
jgi:hypothetical protein